jgi:hypothetical protein
MMQVPFIHHFDHPSGRFARPLRGARGLNVGIVAPSSRPAPISAPGGRLPDKGLLPLAPGLDRLTGAKRAPVDRKFKPVDRTDKVPLLFFRGGASDDSPAIFAVRSEMSIPPSPVPCFPRPVWGHAGPFSGDDDRPVRLPLAPSVLRILFSSPPPAPLTLCRLPKDLNGADARPGGPGAVRVKSSRSGRSFNNSFHELRGSVRAVRVKSYLSHMCAHTHARVVAFYCDSYFPFYLKLPRPPGHTKENGHLTRTVARTAPGPLGRASAAISKEIGG